MYISPVFSTKMKKKLAKLISLNSFTNVSGEGTGGAGVAGGAPEGLNKVAGVEGLKVA